MKYNTTKEELLAATERQMRTDQKNEAFQEEVLSQMATREEALRELQAQLVPQDLDMLRIQIQEELEVPHKQRLGEIEGEVQKWETLYYSVRRVYEKEKTENDLFKEQVKAAIDSDRAVFEAEVKSLEGQLLEMQDRASSLALDESLLEAQANFTQSQLRENQLKAEIDDLRRALSEIDATRQSEASIATERFAQAQAELANSKADLHGQTQRTLEAQSQAASLKVEVDSLREALAEKAAEASKRAERFAGAEKEALEIEKRLEREAERRRFAAEAEQKKLEDRLRRDIDACKLERKSLETERQNSRDRVERVMASEEAARADARQQIEGVEAQLHKALAAESTAREELKREEQKSEERIRANEIALNKAEAAAAKATKEAQLLRLKVARQAEELVAEKREKDLLQQKVKDQEDRIRTLSDSLSKSEMNASELGQAEQVIHEWTFYRCLE